MRHWWCRMIRAIRVAAGQIRHPLLPPIKLDPSQPLSPDEAAVLAVLVNPELRAELCWRDVASAQLLQAGLLPNPQLTGGMDFPYERESPDNFNAYNLGLSWDVTALIARDARIRSASADAASIELQIAWKEWEIAQAARTARLRSTGSTASCRYRDRRMRNWAKRSTRPGRRR